MDEEDGVAVGGVGVGGFVVVALCCCFGRVGLLEWVRGGGRAGGSRRGS